MVVVNACVCCSQGNIVVVFRYCHCRSFWTRVPLLCVCHIVCLPLVPTECASDPPQASSCRMCPASFHLFSACIVLSPLPDNGLYYVGFCITQNIYYLMHCEPYSPARFDRVSNLCIFAYSFDALFIGNIFVHIYICL